MSEFILLKDQYIFQLENAEEINCISLPCVVFPFKRLGEGKVPKSLGTSLGGV